MLARMFAQAYMVGEGQLNMMAPMLRSTLWGWGWLLGAAATLAIIVSLAAARASRAMWRAAAASTFALALSFSLTGHAASVESSTALHVALDAIHVMAAGGWLGTLLVVTTVGLREASRLPTDVRARATAQLVNAFSTFALACVATLAVTGIVAAWSHLPTVPSLWRTHYGLALVRKLVVLSFTGVVGIYNWRVIRPQLEHAGTVKLLRRSATVELALGTVVVILTAVLVATSTPDMDDMPMSSSPAPARTSLLA
ncbi:MAG TPA: CopD family protein, partial [Gemmatimonadaceae bacterium]